MIVFLNPARQIRSRFQKVRPPLREATDTAAITFRLGQIDALARTVLISPALTSPEMRASLALHWLSRAWDQYRKDRAIPLGSRLAGAECGAERNAFLTLLEHALPPNEKPLTQAIRTVRKIAIQPVAGEAGEEASIVAASMGDLDAVLDMLAHTRLPGNPLERVAAIIERFRYSHGDECDALSATARTPCWAINLAAVAQGNAFQLGKASLPFPGIVQRRLFRADRSAVERHAGTCECLLEALRETACDIARIPRMAEILACGFAHQRSNSRLSSAWLLLVGLGSLTPAQLARALPATNAGAAKLLRQLEAKHLARGSGPFEPYICASSFPAAFSA